MEPPTPMAPRFHKLTVTDIRQETPDCISIAFGIPSECREAFAFRPGQNLVLRTRMPDGELRRNYSLCSSPLDGECRIAVKRNAHFMRVRFRRMCRMGVDLRCRNASV
ncbi:MAG: hypothetical protein EBZ67_03875 [Chitinophagia bacterium]|nr:hypothetical protein [Chitinophagia bacterium]